MKYLLIILLIIGNTAIASESSYRKERSQKITKILKLSEKQENQIREIKERYKLTIQKLNKEYLNEEQKFVKAFQTTDKSKETDSKLLTLKKNISQKKLALDYKILEQGLEIRKVLSPQQIIKLNKFVKTYPAKD